MIHPHTELRIVSADIGYGVFATRLIPRGTVIWTLCDLDVRYTPQEVAGMPGHYRDILYKYAYVHPDGRFVLCWDFARYVNHSCDPTNFAIGNDFEIVGRDVLPGEQITCDYGCGNVMDDLECRCGSAACRGVIRPEDALTYGPVWDEIGARSLTHAGRVPQPLRPFIRDKESFDGIVSGRIAMPSVVTLYCRTSPRQAAGRS